MQKAFHSSFVESEDLVFGVWDNVGQRTEIFAQTRPEVHLHRAPTELRQTRMVTIEPIAIADNVTEETMWQESMPLISIEYALELIDLNAPSV